MVRTQPAISWLVAARARENASATSDTSLPAAARTWRKLRLPITAWSGACNSFALTSITADGVAVPALQSFANDGLAQLGPTLAELRGLIRDLRRVTDRLDGGPARYILGRDTPKEFEPQ